MAISRPALLLLLLASAPLRVAAVATAAGASRHAHRAWPWWTNRKESPMVQGEPEPLQGIGTARYPDSHPMLRWDDLEARGQLGGTCDPSGSVAAQCGKDLVCRRGLCRHCIKDSECPSLHHCEKRHFEAHHNCVHIERKAWEMAFTEPLEALCTLAIFFASALAAAAGTGGGGMFVPLLVALSSLTADKAVPTSQCMILFGSVVNLAVFLSQRHPVVRSEPVVDYDCVVLLEPMLCLGVMIGVMINQITPNWLLLLLLCATLGFALWRTGSKGVKQLKAELAAPPVPVVQTPVVSPRATDRRPRVILFCKPVSEDFLELTDKKAWQVVLTVFVWLVMLAFSFHGLAVCTRRFAVFLLQLAVGLVVITGIAIHMIGQSRRAEPDAGDGDEEVRVPPAGAPPVKNGPVDWTGGGHGSGGMEALLKILKFPCAAFGAGFLGGLLGLGGGIIMSPVLIEVGMHSEAVQATTALFVFLSSSLATIQFWRLQQHVWHYALWYSTVCVLATILGQHLCEVYVRKRQRYSLITLAIAGVLMSSLMALSVIGTAQVVEDIYMGRQMWFSMEHLCNKEGLGIVAVDIAPASPWPKDLPKR